MAPKRARTAAASSSASSSSQPANAAATKLTLYGGVPHHPSLAGLWREERLTDFAVCAEGVEFKAHRVALASSSKYFLNLFESGMRDAADATHALEGIRPTALEALLAFIYEGKCEIDEGQLTEVLEASARLVVDALKDACAHVIGARLAPSSSEGGAGRAPAASGRVFPPRLTFGLEWVGASRGLARRGVLLRGPQHLLERRPVAPVA